MLGLNHTPCPGEGWRDRLCPEPWQMLGGELPILPPVLEVALTLARAQAGVLAAPALSLGGFATSRKGPGPRVLLCPPAQGRLGAGRGRRSCLNPRAGWKPSAWSCRTSPMGWRALESLWGWWVPSQWGPQGCLCLPLPRC